MSLSANMWTSVSGLLTHGEKMNVIGNNLANVSTVGFKAQRADFADFFYTEHGTMNGQTQVGKGVAIAALIGDFSQGGYESTNSATDLAINGSGFFKVRNTGTNAPAYTRAGDFFFDNERQLVNPSGMILQGWRVNQAHSINISVDEAVSQATLDSDIRRTGLVKDIVLDQWNLVPARTTNVKIANNLVNDNSYDVCSGATSPLTALFDSWDATKANPLADDQYATQSTIAAYDESGRSHELTVYMDKVNSTLLNADQTVAYGFQNIPEGYSVYEYLVTTDPKDDMRTVAEEGGEVPLSRSTQRKAGVLLSGVMIFDEAGQLVNQSAYTYNGGVDVGDAADFTSNKANWTPTSFSSNGLPVFTANFSSKDNGDYVDLGTVGENLEAVNAANTMIELDFGLRTTTTTAPWRAGLPAADEEAPAPDAQLGSLADLAVANGVVDFNNLNLVANTAIDKSATANNGSSFQNDIQDDGYPAGLLSNYKFDTDGVVYGYYDNGESIPLYQIAMYDFHSTQGLRREGGNLFTPTPESGEPIEGVAGTGTFGTITSYYIENSNVDMSREFVQMISCQRGFQANSKSVTTTDTMLETVINMKR